MTERMNDRIKRREKKIVRVNLECVQCTMSMRLVEEGRKNASMQSARM